MKSRPQYNKDGLFSTARRGPKSGPAPEGQLTETMETKGRQKGDSNHRAIGSFIPTKLNVFNTESELQFDINTPGFIKEVAENSGSRMYSVCWNIFQRLIAMVAERATELNDPIMNVLMLRMNLYEVDHEERVRAINRIKQQMKSGEYGYVGSYFRDESGADKEAVEKLSKACSESIVSQVRAALDDKVLDEEIEKVFDENDWNCLEDMDTKLFARHFMEWQKKRMMDGLAKITACGPVPGVGIGDPTYVFSMPLARAEELGIKRGNKFIINKIEENGKD